MLEHEADAAVAHGQCSGVFVVEQDAASRRALQSRHQPQERRLARARRAEQRQQLARPHLEVEVADGRRAVERLGEPFGPYRDRHA